MYNMCAERAATENGTGLSWHGIDREGNDLCARIFSDTAASTPDGVCDRDDDCRSCMNFVAQAVRPSPVTADSSAPVGDATQRNSDLIAPNPGGQPRGH
ncbi:hypothetical protein [Streptomyces sp. Ncost-T10-10d]|uniref:hypothetical protein n=1 Tax=Streptomyces sp. Ncost-T10-10d TaxID=1839774 RepID=UPI00081EC86B|nr:hypothetical protein [Streptomyces sp. Ncost-T10-10d]SCF83494.1 hypothetical protein GA0115254_1185119 [Streptomyces sp. Ncost-T10-10d]